MSYQKYPKYKENSIPWIDKIPVEWNLVDLRRGISFLTDFEANGSFADVKKNVDLESDIKFAWYLRATDLQNNRIGMIKENRTCDEKAYNYLFKTKLYGGEFLVAKRGEIGKTYVVPDLPCKATLAPNLYLIRLNNKLSSKFAFYWFSSAYGKPELELANKSTTIGALYKDDVRACKIILPPFNEQTQIANFLDYETAKIDTLIEKQQQLIKLLKEKRQAVISHAVTKGLNPDAPKKDSGVEWLGEVPEHWDVKKLKFMANIQPSNIDKKTKDGELPIVLCNYTDVYYNDFVDKSMDFMKASATIEQIEKFTLQAGDIIITKDSEDPNDIAIPTFVSEYMPGVVCGYHLSVVRSFNKYYSAYIKRVFECGYARAYFATRSNGLTRYGLGTYALENVFYPKPPKEDAVAITKFLDNETTKIDILIGKAYNATELLQERRTALISAAVTGKIDVRNWKSPEQNKTSKEDVL